MSEIGAELRKLIKESKSLPTLPGIITKLSALEANPKSTSQEIARLIASDQILSAKVLRLVNSPFYGFSRRVSTVSNALILLGISVIKSLIMSTSIFEMMEKTLLGLWEHSLATAVAANLVATRLELSDKEEISTAALLHDIGKVVIKVQMKDDYEKLLATAGERQLFSFEAEQELLGVNHAEVGRWLAESWFLPEKLIEPIACHHDLEKSVQFRNRTAVVHFADILVRARGFGAGVNELAPRLHPLVVSELRLDSLDLSSLLAELDDRLVEVKNFSMDIQEQPADDA